MLCCVMVGVFRTTIDNPLVDHARQNSFNRIKQPQYSELSYKWPVN